MVLDHGPATSGFRSDPAGGVPQEVVISIRQLEGDPPRIDVDRPDSAVDFPGLETWTPREARLIGGFMISAADLLERIRMTSAGARGRLSQSSPRCSHVGRIPCRCVVQRGLRGR